MSNLLERTKLNFVQILPRSSQIQGSLAATFPNENFNEMKKLFLTFLISLIFACSQKNNKDENVISITIKKDESINLNSLGNPIIVTLKNNSNKIFPIWIMSCNYNKNFITNNKNIEFPAIDCDKNIPKLYNLNPLEEKEIKLYVIYSVGLPKQKFKIGFLMNKEFSTVEKYQNEISNKENLKIIWSNQLSI